MSQPWLSVSTFFVSQLTTVNNNAKLYTSAVIVSLRRYTSSSQDNVRQCTRENTSNIQSLSSAWEASKKKHCWLSECVIKSKLIKRVSAVLLRLRHAKANLTTLSSSVIVLPLLWLLVLTGELYLFFRCPFYYPSLSSCAGAEFLDSVPTFDLLYVLLPFYFVDGDGSQPTHNSQYNIRDREQLSAVWKLNQRFKVIWHHQRNSLTLFYRLIVACVQFVYLNWCSMSLAEMNPCVIVGKTMVKPNYVQVKPKSYPHG